MPSSRSVVLLSDARDCLRHAEAGPLPFHGQRSSAARAACQAAARLWPAGLVLHAAHRNLAELVQRVRPTASIGRSSPSPRTRCGEGPPRVAGPHRAAEDGRILSLYLLLLLFLSYQPRPARGSHSQRCCSCIAEAHGRSCALRHRRASILLYPVLLEQRSSPSHLFFFHSSLIASSLAALQASETVTCRGGADTAGSCSAGSAWCSVMQRDAAPNSCGMGRGAPPMSTERGGVGESSATSSGSCSAAARTPQTRSHSEQASVAACWQVTAALAGRGEGGEKSGRLRCSCLDGGGKMRSLEVERRCVVLTRLHPCVSIPWSAQRAQSGSSIMSSS